MKQRNKITPIVENGVLKVYAPSRRIDDQGVLRMEWRDKELSHDIVIPSGVKVIGGLKVKEDSYEAYNEDSFIDIFYHPFIYNLCVKSVVMGDEVVEIGDKAFEHCENLLSVTLSKKIEKIGCNAFLGCKSLVELVIPSSVKEIGSYAFDLCPHLVLKVTKNSYAEQFAKKHKLTYEYIK